MIDRRKQEHTAGGARQRAGQLNTVERLKRSAILAALVKTKPSKKKKSSIFRENIRRFRRIKIVRPCVLRLLFLIPVLIVGIEKYLGYVISLDDVQDAYRTQLGTDPIFIPPPLADRLGPVHELVNLTFTPGVRCQHGLRRMMVVHNPQFNGLSSRLVPRIVHQTAETRCLTQNFARASMDWAFRKHSYYIHDSDAVARLLKSEFPEFPQIKMIQSDCLEPALARGLWKYLALWVWGGVYADLNTRPKNFNGSFVSNEEDGMLFWNGNSTIISSLVMVASPRHPIMYYAVQHCLQNILGMRPDETYEIDSIVGDKPLNEAFKDFVKQTRSREAENSLSKDFFEGVHGRSIRIVGSVDELSHLVMPLFISKSGKEKELLKMGIVENNVVDASRCFEKMKI